MDRETLINEKIARIRAKNEAIKKRHAEVEEDRKRAEHARSSITTQKVNLKNQQIVRSFQAKISTYSHLKKAITSTDHFRAASRRRDTVRNRTMPGVRSSTIGNLGRIRVQLAPVSRGNRCTSGSGRKMPRRQTRATGRKEAQCQPTNGL